jgi:hypothetical protein
MRRLLTATLALGALFLSTNPAHSAVCLCAKAPMYPLPGGNWMHYAIVCNNSGSGCIDDHPTGYVGSPVGGQDCSTSATCTTCNDITLCELDAQLPTDELPSFFFADAPLYSQVNTVEGITKFLTENPPGEAEDPITYDDFQITSPTGNRLPYIVRLERYDENGIVEDFYAVIWMISSAKLHTRAFIGVECEPDAQVPFPPHQRRPSHSQHAPVATALGFDEVFHSEPIPGLLQVQFGPLGAEDVAFLRLEDSEKNTGYPPYKEQRLPPENYCEPGYGSEPCQRCYSGQRLYYHSCQPCRPYRQWGRCRRWR